ncbi:NAD(P)/FAD-dependent oxidoreductase [Promicromonospora thailandica]|uniref:Dehydrogenase (Flavoprotein) n=1 Tax=Promicromonospora thailandica TaxID=765201 RepID=A0A9X2G5S7_9MICO|nr:NAD(P)/FAD-dependent oxidoreductase [Promicromonospora thailandica]MCP2263769.1 Dehydrogenase (flavoprotein) [Promicromonospora thailandica]BFF17945.1 geranylgeranyl reductase family protein [Promicromonospora thailandica]
MAGTEAPRILVVGGGPTGAVTAVALRRELPGARVTLIDKATFPRDKTCGDGLGPGARRVLDGLGLSHLLRDFHMPMSVAISGPGGVEAFARGPLMDGHDLAGYVAPRLVLDDLLLGAARDAGADVHEGVAFRGMTATGDGELVDLPSGETAFDLVVGADGAYSTVRRALGVDRPAMGHTHVAMRAYGTVTHPDKPVGDTLRFDFLESLLPVYGWVFPLPGDGANIGVGLPVDQLKRQTARHGRTLRDLFDLYVEDLRGRGFEVSGLGRVATHQLPHAAARTPMTAPGRAAVLLGDAAATINPLSGEGIFYGMAAGVQLAEHLGALDRAGEDWRGAHLAGALGGFERAHRDRFGRHYRECYLAQRLMSSRAWAGTATRAVAASDEAMAHVALMLFDEQSAGSRGLLRLVGSILRPLVGPGRARR